MLLNVFQQDIIHSRLPAIAGSGEVLDDLRATLHRYRYAGLLRRASLTREAEQPAATPKGSDCNGVIRIGRAHGMAHFDLHLMLTKADGDGRALLIFRCCRPELQHGHQTLQALHRVQGTAFRQD